MDENCGTGFNWEMRCGLCAPALFSGTFVVIYGVGLLWIEKEVVRGLWRRGSLCLWSLIRVKIFRVMRE